MAKLTDRQRKRIVAEYIEGDGRVSQQALADKYHVSRQAISSILRDEKNCEKLQAKKDENTRSMLEYLDERKGQAQSLIDQILSSAGKDIEKACLRDKIGALKILSEVFGGGRQEAKDDVPVQIIIEAEDASAED